MASNTRASRAPWQVPPACDEAMCLIAEVCSEWRDVILHDDGAVVVHTHAIPFPAALERRWVAATPALVALGDVLRTPFFGTRRSYKRFERLWYEIALTGAVVIRGAPPFPRAQPVAPNVRRAQVRIIQARRQVCTLLVGSQTRAAYLAACARFAARNPRIRLRPRVRTWGASVGPRGCGPGVGASAT